MKSGKFARQPQRLEAKAQFLGNRHLARLVSRYDALNAALTIIEQAKAIGIRNMLPISSGAVIFAFLFGGNGIALAHYFLWRRSQTLFWLASALILIGIGYLVATGAADSIARALWPMPFDATKMKDTAQRVACSEPRLLGFMVIAWLMTPILLSIVALRFRHVWPITQFRHSWPMIVLRRSLATILLTYPWAMFLFRRPWALFLFEIFLGACLLLVFVSPIPETLANLIFSEETLTMSNNCKQTD